MTTAHVGVDVTTAPPAVLDAIRGVDDPEYPGVSIVDLGLVEGVRTASTGDGIAVTVELIPTFGGCPALGMIADDVRAAVGALDDVSSCEVRWLSSPVWSTERITPAARAALRTGFTVALRGRDGGVRCPVCGSAEVQDRSDAGPVRCRSVAWCASCRNVVEVMR